MVLVFKITTSGVFSTLYKFSRSDGADPEAALVQASDGNFYGTTLSGGINNYGTVFRLTPAGSLTVLYEFSSADGGPSAPLLIASDGSFYGTTYSVSSTHFGKIFRVTPSGVFSIVHSFAGSDGRDPYWGLIQGADGKLYGTTSEGGTNDHGTIFSLTLGDTSSSSLSVHPIPTAALLAASTDNVDAALGVMASETLLKTNEPSLTGGLVADGVTPLLIELDTNPAPSQATTFTFGVTVAGGQLATGALGQYLYVLQQSGGNAQFVPGNSVVVSPSHPSGFAYISGIKSEDVQFSAGSKELTVTLCATEDGDTTPTATVNFRIRKPPIVLVHGYNSDNGAWYENDALTVPNAFLSALQTSFPADFILPVEYGVDRSGNKADDSTNISGAFEYLAPLLDSQLRTYVENPSSLWHQAWAFTRYNIVGHSQGGVLVRMLCTGENPDPLNPHPSFKPFRSDNNGYRGRFHRVITLNSPHNGTTLVHYSLEMASAGYSLFEGLKAAGLLQPKFDPFGNEIMEINVHHWSVDPAAKFHLIGTTIHGGTPPAVGDSSPRCYSYTGLSGHVSGQSYSRGSIVIPNGSDGVVDFTSEFAGFSPGVKTTIIQGVDISHSGPAPHDLFGVLDDDHIVTRSVTVANRVVDLLSNPSSEFGGFGLVLVNPALEGQINAVVPPVNVNGPVIFSIHPRMTANLKRTMSPAAVYGFGISPSTEQQPASPPNWYVEVFGPNGIVQDGVTVTPDSNDPNIVSVAVEDTVVGDVVVHVTYEDINGNLVTTTPVVVVSMPPGTTMTGIELLPSMIGLTVGSTVVSEVWADYDNGTRSQIYIPTGATISYTSDDNIIASVDTTGKIVLNAAGTTNIHVSYLGFSAQSPVTVFPLPPPPLVAPMGAVSRKVHGGAGTFDIDLPLTGNAGIECRSGGASGDYQVIVTFASPVTLSNVTVGATGGGNTTSSASVTGYSINGSQVSIDLTELPNAQTSLITLSNVSDGAATNDVIIPMSVLLGDTTGNGTVNSSDVSQVKLKSGQAVDATNFRADVGVNGSINSSDVSQVKLQSGTALP